MAEPIPEKEIEGAYELPEGWVWCTWNDLVDWITYGFTRPMSHVEHGVPIITAKNIINSMIDFSFSNHTTEEAFRKLSEKDRPRQGEILITKDGSIGRAAIVDSEKCFCINQSVALLRFGGLTANVRYLLKAIESQFTQDLIEKGAKGTAIRHISITAFGKFPIPLPPLAEQHRIVAKLEALLAQVNAAKDHLAAVPPIIKRFRQSVLAAACSGRLTEDWRREHLDAEPASELLKRIREERIRKYEEECQKAKVDGRRKPRKPSNITQNEFAVEGLIVLPNGWTWAALDDLSANEANSIADGPFGSKLKTEHYTESGPRVIRLQNIGDGKFIDAKAHISPHHFENLRKHEIFGGDIVIAALGTDLPRACIIPNYVGHAIVKADCIRFKPHISITNNQYMNASLNSDILKHIAQSIVHGVGRPRLNQQQVKSLPIPLPPLSEQRAIVNRIEALFHRTSKVEERVAAATAHADRLTQSILAKAFRGELVPQDPDDEPASVLLERIRKERAELKKKPQKRRSKTLPDSS